LNKYTLLILTMLCSLLAATNAIASCAKGEEPLASCQVAGQQKKVSICLTADKAIYRFGPMEGNPELVLREPLMALGYLRKDGAKETIDETVTFSNQDYSYRVSFGFRDGLQPDPTELRKFGAINVLQKNQTFVELMCAPESIQRTPDMLFDKMRKAGRERTSDGEVFSNYDIHYPGPVSQSSPCDKENDVDTCWSYGVAASRGGDLALALGYFDKSCDAALFTYGCYEAGKLYLQNRKLRDYAKASDRLIRVCNSDEIGQGPYACKYLGWMHHTGIGAEKDARKAWDYLAKACFLHNELTIDAEGCHFFAKTVLKVHPLGNMQQQRKQVGGAYLAYLALAMGCSDGAEGLCAEAKSFLANGKASSAAWVTRCDQAISGTPPANNCAGLIVQSTESDSNSELRKQILSHFDDGLAAAEDSSL
jgi:hypothetical protein